MARPRNLETKRAARVDALGSGSGNGAGLFEADAVELVDASGSLANASAAVLADASCSFGAPTRSDAGKMRK